MRKTKVLYIHQDGQITGSAISLRHFLAAINRTVFEPMVLLAEEGPARNLYEDLGIEVKVYPFARFWTFPGPKWYQKANLKQLKALLPNTGLASYVKKLAPDIIHINDKAALAAGISLKKLGIPIVQHSRSSYCIVNSKLNKQLSAKAISNYSSCIIAISEDETDGHEGFSNLQIINNTVDAEKVQQALQQKDRVRAELGIQAADIAIGLVADISAKKGAWSFLEMAATLVKNRPQTPFKFIMVGKVETGGNTILNNGQALHMSPQQYIQQFAAQNNLQDKLVVTGFRKDALAIMAGLDILVVANSNGVMGRQPIEAQALGIPTIVAQGHSGKSTILVHNHAGLVIDNPVQLNQLVAAAEDLTDHPEKRTLFGANGRLYAQQRFTPATNMGQIEKIYQQLVS